MVLSAAFLLIALTYASVGQAGASGYLAVMALAGIDSAAMKVTALALNLLVAGIGSYQFMKAGRLSWQNVYPFAVLGFPFSLMGGAVQLPLHIYYPVVGVVLVLSGTQMARTAMKGRGTLPAPSAPPFVPALCIGAGIGFVSGTTGTGGGVFLAPIILAMNWGTTRQTAATTAVYNLINSAAALLGAMAIWNHAPSELSLWLVAVAVGGTIGAYIGSRYLPEGWLKAILALLLILSGLKLLVS